MARCVAQHPWPRGGVYWCLGRTDRIQHCGYVLGARLNLLQLLLLLLLLHRCDNKKRKINEAHTPAPPCAGWGKASDVGVVAECVVSVQG